MKVFDCFTFHNEIDMLKYRLHLLDPVVDKFILIEAIQTHTGHPKPLHYDLHKDTLFKDYKHKIEHVVVSLPATAEKIKSGALSAWDNEKYQRNLLEHSIHELAESDSDIFILSDLDELPDPNTITKIKNGEIDTDIGYLDQDLYYYNIQCKLRSNWTLAKVFKYGWFRNASVTCDAVRLNVPSTRIPSGGWHLSYFGDINFIKNKIKNMAHQEFNTDHFKSEEYIEHCILNNICLVGEDRKIDYILPKDNTYLPPDVLTYLTL
jgi:beta-1,4-mannosyl-glycoprotein beta-1,4-N-acetylglucosaminyltransferase